MFILNTMDIENKQLLGEMIELMILENGIKNNGKKVGVFPVDTDSWFDVGQWAEYRQTVKML